MEASKMLASLQQTPHQEGPSTTYLRFRVLEAPKHCVLGLSGFVQLSPGGKALHRVLNARKSTCWYNHMFAVGRMRPQLLGNHARGCKRVLHVHV